jgi:hypothetical protein
MSHSDKIKSVLSQIDPGKPILRVRISHDKTALRSSEIGSWQPNIGGDSFHEKLVKEFVRRKIQNSYSPKGYVIDVDVTLSNINSHMTNEVLPLYSKVCFNSSPRRTKLYKQLILTLKKLNRGQNENLLNFIFDVVQYADSASRENSLTHPDNIVHRKNILKLFEIMEKKHGSNSASK